MNPTNCNRGVILFAHGSRDALWRVPVEAVASDVRAREPGLLVECAYLELTTPSLPDAAATLVGAGVRQLRVLPVFLGVGKHAREDLPVLIAELRAAYPGLLIELLPAAGEHPLLISLLAQIALGEV